MPRYKATTEVSNVAEQPTQPKKPSLSDYVSGVPMFQRENAVGVSALPLTPMHTPPDIFLAWAVDGTGDGSIEDLREKGYVFLTDEYVTRDPDEARRKGLVALRYYSVDEARRVRYRDLYAMVTSAEARQRRLRSLLNSYVVRDPSKDYQERLSKAENSDMLMAVKDNDDTRLGEEV